MTEWAKEARLPFSARTNLSTPVREAINVPLNLPGWHTLPIRPPIWSIYAEQIRQHVSEFEVNCTKGPGSSDFNGIRTWLDNLLQVRNRILSITLALAPFEYFDEDSAREMLGFLDLRLFDITRELHNTSTLLTDASAKTITDWLTVAECPPKDLIAQAFNLDPEGLYDESGEFSPGRVFSSYYLRNGELLQRVLPHLGSLRLPQVGDLLVAVAAVGWILGCEDPIAAYCSMDAFRSGLYRAHGSQITKTSLRYLERSEPELRQGRLRINRAMAHIMDGNDEETSQLALADLYKRLIEGPFRKYGWALHCLNSGHWSDPPMLTQLRDALVSRRGWLGSVAEQVVIRDIRNGEAHETLIWDGIESKFLAEGVEVEVHLVAHAAILADAFARGCEAAIACYKTLEAEHKSSLPREQDLGRLAPWRRAEAIFGTNGIRVVRANFNSKIAKITCFQLQQGNINPCFQALVACHGLLPQVERFEVLTLEASEPVISVSRDTLKRTLPVWETAIETLSAMPFSTFLPMNLDSRSRSESLSRATRSAAWIAVDDFLDALDGSAEQWEAEDVELFSRRIAVIALATAQCLAALPQPAQLRLRAVQEAGSEMATWLRGISTPMHWKAVAQAEPVARFRHWWVEWGPVDRLPSVPSSVNQSEIDDHRPALKDEPGDLRWRTI